MTTVLVLATSFCVVLSTMTIRLEATPTRGSLNSTVPSTKRPLFGGYANIRNVLLFRKRNFPILSPRLRTTSSPITTSLETTTLIPTTSAASEAPSASNLIILRREDQFESSPSDNSPFVVWPVPRRPPSRRFRAPPSTTTAPRLLLKLLQPKPTRPAVYSLDGFVPKPSITRISTTEPPLQTNLQFLASTLQQRKTSLYIREDEEDDYQNDFHSLTRKKKPVSRYTAFARKGIPGEDFPVYTHIPQTDFDCSSRAGPGVFADPYTDCQVWHMCPGGSIIPRHSFLCPNGTIFNEYRRVCDWWYNVDCDKGDRKK